MSALETCQFCGWGIIPRNRWKAMTIEARKQALEHSVRDKYRNGECRTCYQRKDYTPSGPSPAQVAADRLEDLCWMAETGECLLGAAARLGITERALERFLARHDPDLRRVLVARNPRDHNTVPDGKDTSRWMPNPARDARDARRNAKKKALRQGAAA